MSQDLLTIGEFAKLARTTKRTVLWYEEKGILKPKATDSTTGYRFYEPAQIIDFQAILLLRRLNFSIEEIKTFLANHSSPQKLFDQKKSALKEEIADLTQKLEETETYYANVQKTGTLVSPIVKEIKSLSVYYIEKRGPYASIGSYFEELASYFKTIPQGTLGLTIYEDIGYQPKMAKTKICFVIRSGLILKSDTKKLAKRMTLPSFKALSYTHNGPSRLLSMLWQELKKYRVKNDYIEDKSLPFEDLELSHGEHSTEMLLPIK